MCLERLEYNEEVKGQVEPRGIVDNRLAEMQLRVLWQEILERLHSVELVGEPVHTASCFVKGYRELPVRLRVS